MAAICSSERFSHYRASTALSGYPFEQLVEKEWISPELAKDPDIVAKYRMVFESSAFKRVVDGAVELSPISSIDRLKGVIYAQWTVEYLKIRQIPKDERIFEQAIWARSCCPLLVDRLFPEQGEPGLNRDTFLNYKTDTQADILLRLDLLCQTIAKNYDENQVQSFLEALGLSEEAEWVSSVLKYATLGEMEPEAIVKILCEAEVIRKKQR